MWTWIATNIPVNLKRKQNSINNTWKLSDDQSYLIEVPMLRQIRVDPKSNHKIRLFKPISY